MQGLLSQNPGAQPAPAASPGAQGPQSPQGSQEQQMYDTVVGQTTEYIYGQGLENVKQRLQAGAEDGVEDDVGAVVGQLLAMNYQSAMESQHSIPPKVMAGAAKELTELVTDIAVQMQLISPQEADEAADEALYVAMGTFGRSIPNMPPQEQQEYAMLLQQLEAEESQAKGMMAQPSPLQGGQPAGALP